jgi:hypothetical protein
MLLRTNCLALALIALFLPGCTTTPRCLNSLSVGWTDTVFLGLSRSDGSVITEAQWNAFIETSVSTRFPSGFTVVNAVGQWRDQQGRIQQEPSRLLVIVQTEESGSLQRLKAVVDDYKTRFQQEAVLISRSNSCIHR